jgi:hypothetical protein
MRGFVLALTMVWLSPVAAARAAAQDTAGAALEGQVRALHVDEDALRRVLEDPETFNHLFERLAGTGGAGWRLLQDLHLKFKTFDAQDADTRGLGFSYAFDKVVQQQAFDTAGTAFTTLDFHVQADGNVAFKSSINPRDFLTTGATLALQRSRGGTTATTAAERRELSGLEQKLAEYTTEEQIASSSELRRYLEIVAPHLGTQLALELGASARLESDQLFNQKQYAYAAQLGLDLKAWNRSSTLARWNLFDWPAAVLRYLAGTDARFTPRGSTIPTVRLAIARVDPSENDGREALGVTSSFTRANLEVAYRGLVARVAGGDLFLESGLRWYRELSAPAAIRSAGLDEFTYFAAALTSTDGPFVSYSTGRLPLDAASDKVYELGFKVDF